jgi:signal peptidase II
MIPDAAVRRRNLVTALSLAALVIALDQLSKWFVLTRLMSPPRVIEVTPFFNLVAGWNYGVSFGLFNEPGEWNAAILTLVAVSVVGLLLWWLSRITRRRLTLAIGLIIGGAIGNVIDRLRFGAVFDFLDVHVAGYHWPAFNVADSAITIGVAVILLDSLFEPADESKRDRAEQTGNRQ